MTKMHDIKFRARCIHSAVMFCDALRRLSGNDSITSAEYLVFGPHDEDQSYVECRMSSRVSAEICQELAGNLQFEEIALSIDQASNYKKVNFTLEINQRWPQ